jgi:hypothetical protein
MRDRFCLFPCAGTVFRALAATAVIASGSGALAQPFIRHDEVRCIPRDQFTEFVADVVPPDQLRSVRLYFRSELFPEYYFVDMSVAEAHYAAVLPLPTEQTRRVVYYIEVVDQTFETSRSEEFVVDVEQDHCDPGPGALLFAGNPGIVVGAVSVGAPGIPAGFQATGIAGFVSAAGAGGGGLGVGLAIGAAAGAAAGVGVLVASNDGTVAGTGGSPSTVTTSTPGLTGGGPSPTSTVPSSGGPSPTTTTTANVPQGPPTSTTTSEPPPPLAACFTWLPENDCRGELVSCSEPERLIVSHDWRILGPPVPAIATVPGPEENARRLPFDFTGDPRCNGSADFNRPVRLTVTDSLERSAQVQQNISVRPAAALTSMTTGIIIRSNLTAQPPDGSVRGQILIDGVALPVVTNRGPLELRTDVAGAEPIVEAVLETRTAPGTLWEFALSTSRGSDFASLDPVSGTAILVEGARIVFRLEGREGERLRFRARAR